MRHAGAQQADRRQLLGTAPAWRASAAARSGRGSSRCTGSARSVSTALKESSRGNSAASRLRPVSSTVLPTIGDADADALHLGRGDLACIRRRHVATGAESSKTPGISRSSGCAENLRRFVAEDLLRGGVEQARSGRRRRPRRWRRGCPRSAGGTAPPIPTAARFLAFHRHGVAHLRLGELAAGAPRGPFAR